MTRCPVCHSVHILPVKVHAQPGGLCKVCGSRWTYRATEEKSIRRGRFAPSVASTGSAR